MQFYIHLNSNESQKNNTQFERFFILKRLPESTMKRLFGSSPHVYLNDWIAWAMTAGSFQFKNLKRGEVFELKKKKNHQILLFH